MPLRELAARLLAGEVAGLAVVVEGGRSEIIQETLANFASSAGTPTTTFPHSLPV